MAVGPACYYHPDKPAILQIPLDGGGKAPVCVRCHAKIKNKENK